VDANTSGTLYFDDFESRRFSYIGTLPDPGVNDPQPSNQAGWFARTYTYSTTIPHAVTNVTPETGSPDTYSYDANGNMTCRIENGVVYTHAYNAENRASSIAKRSGDCATGTILESWSFAYDGDGVRVLTAHYTGVTLDSMTMYYMGGMYEVTGSAVKKYYSIAGQTVAMNDGSGLKYLLTDHLGSTSAVVDSNGSLLSQQRYLPFGEVRSDVGSITQTDFGYTFQRALTGTGLMDYRARFYSVSLGRFVQPDSIIPNPRDPQNWNRFSYVLNNPIRYIDPSGHRCKDGNGDCSDITTLLIKNLESKYDAKLVGGWSKDELLLLSKALNKAAKYAGGAENLNDVFLDGMQANGYSGDTLIFNNTGGNDSPCSNGGYACWDGDDGTILLSDFIFKPEYQNVLQQRPDTALGVQQTIIHEVAHVFADARPAMVGLYSGFVDNPTIFYTNMKGCEGPCLYEENMATLIGKYVITGNINTPDQLEFVLQTQHYWEAWP